MSSNHCQGVGDPQSRSNCEGVDGRTGVLQVGSAGSQDFKYKMDKLCCLERALGPRSAFV